MNGPAEIVVYEKVHIAGFAALALTLSACGGGTPPSNAGGGNNGGNTDNSIPTAATAPQFKGMGLSGADIFVYTDVIARCTLETVDSSGKANSVVMARTAQSNATNGRNFYYVGTASGSFKKISFTRLVLLHIPLSAAKTEL